MRDDLLDQLGSWHEEDEYQEIIDAIMEIPPGDRDYVLTSHLGRALNNLGRYEDGLEQFLTIAEEGKEDPLWHYRIGVSYYYLEQYDQALKEFKMADKLEPDDEDTLEFIDWCRREKAKKPAKVVKAAIAAFDSSNFWNDSEDALEQYVSEPPTPELIASVEEELVFKLPAFYIDMMKLHNGGIPNNTHYPIEGDASGAKSHISVSGILGIGREKSLSLCGDLGSRYRIENGGYPEFGVVICDCSSEHEVVMLDYRSCGNDGEPEVVHVDRENNYKITYLAKNFETFIRGLVNEETYVTKQ
ncbi:SMI1/KNR4 family protein [Paenibacillus wynnii]|uniref:Cell wall assembly protein n=1 Tax=Paenibacillus wynnii TaxID=268407 RepID=A0A098MDI2_9BACL|nr:SMI1/KNR4 family protein [Paenibacillus wynnii]KGE20113.1 cell wall assembly protein [Paenibacillus wynnii]